MSAESSDNWGPNGLGYWLASRMLWDIRESERVEALVEDFLDKSFGPAKEPMRAFYEQLDGSKPKLVVDDQLGRMYRALHEARRLAAGRPDVLRRLDELLLYARYCTLFYRYARADGEPRQQAFENLIRHAWRMRTTMMVHSHALYRDVTKRDKTVKIPAGAGVRDPEPTNPWKSSAPFSSMELDAFLTEGIQSHPLVALTFAPRQYSSDLRPVGEHFDLKDLQDLPPLDASFTGRGTQHFLTWTREAGQSIDLLITGGLIAHYRDRGNVKVELIKVGGTSVTGDADSLVDRHDGTPPDGQTHAVHLKAADPGLYRISISDGKDRTQVQWPEQLPLVLASSSDQPMNATYRQWAGYFHVPKGTRHIGLFGGEHGEVLDADGRIHFWLNGREPNYYSVEVPDGQDGRFWRVRYVRGALRLLTVPPYFARSPAEMLLPVEVLQENDR